MQPQAGSPAPQSPDPGHGGPPTPLPAATGPVFVRETLYFARFPGESAQRHHVVLDRLGFVAFTLEEREVDVEGIGRRDGLGSDQGVPTGIEDRAVVAGAAGIGPAGRGAGHIHPRGLFLGVVERELELAADHLETEELAVGSRTMVVPGIFGASFLLLHFLHFLLGRGLDVGAGGCRLRGWRGAGLCACIRLTANRNATRAARVFMAAI